MSGPTADGLRDALSALADALDSVINALPAGSADRISAQTNLRNAASDIDALDVEATIQDSAALSQLKTLTTQINASAASISAAAANVDKYVTIGTKALTLATSLAGGTVSTVVTAATGLAGAL